MYDYLFISEQVLSLLAVLCFYFIDHYSHLQHKKWLNPQFETPSYSAKINRGLMMSAMVILFISFLVTQAFTLFCAGRLSRLEPVVYMGISTRLILFFMMISGWLNLLFILLLLAYFKLKPKERYPVLHKMLLFMGATLLTLFLFKTGNYLVSLDTILLPSLNRPTHYLTNSNFISLTELLLLGGLLAVLFFSYHLLRRKRKNIYYNVYLIVNLVLFLFLLIPYYQMATLLYNIDVPSSMGISGFTYENYYIFIVLSFLFSSAGISIVMAGVYIALSPRMLVPSFGRAYALKYAAINFTTVIILAVLPIYPLLLTTVFS